MQCSLFTATSVHGIIDKEDGNVDLLHASGESGVGMVNTLILFSEYVFNLLIV